MRVAIIYDCLFPNTVGGAERWCRALAERLDTRHEVTYVTRRQWGAEGPRTPFRTIPVSPGGELYTRAGRRRIGPPLRFGIGVFLHLLRHARDYDVVHCTSFPYFSLLGAKAALALRRSPAKLIVDWHEVWGRDYWRGYLGPVLGPVGHWVQKLCVKAPDHSFTFSRMHAARLEGEGHRAPVTRLTGEFAPASGTRPARVAEPPEPPLVLFAGRHIPEKRVPAIPPAIARARETLPGLRCLILGDGPDFDSTRELVAELGLGGAIEMPGRVPAERVAAEMARASCLLLPSQREGYGLVVVEAVSLGTPAIVVAGPENASVELVESGVNGTIAPSAEPNALAGAIASVIAGGSDLRRSTADWYEAHAEELSIESSLAEVESVYGSPTVGSERSVTFTGGDGDRRGGDPEGPIG